MSKMLQSFTLSYPDRTWIGPKVIVLFTNFSQFAKDEDESACLSYDDEDEEDTEAGASAVSNTVTSPTFDLIIDNYKKNLVDLLI